jgi:homoserine O-acetyltransferase
MADTMTAIGKGSQCSYLNIDSDYGHDAFLVELDKFKERIIEILT